MATVRVILDSATDPANGGQAQAWYEYDDATLLVTALGGANATTQPGWVQLTRTDAGHAGQQATRTAQPGTSGNVNVAGLGMHCTATTNQKSGAIEIDPPFTVESRWPA